MPRHSSVKRLPQEIQDEINALLSSGRATLDEVLTQLRGMGVDNVSRSALGRHKQQMDQVLERLRQSREMTDAIVGRLGADAAEGRQGRALVQLVSALAGDYMTRRLDDPESDTEAKDIMALARAVKDTSAAARNSQDFELKLREKIQKETVAAVEDSAREAGLSAETVEAIKSRILGVKDA